MQQLFEFLSHRDASIRSEAAKLVKEQLLDNVVKSNVSGDTDHQAQIRALIDLLINTKHPDNPNYAVDALWGQWTHKKDNILKVILPSHKGAHSFN